MIRVRGFTLIELLVVISIIGILAVIAVPNFLEAQTRSKVAKAQANLRTVAGGLTIARVDHNEYPETSIKFPDDPFGILAAVQLQSLTTPIAYISSDAFVDPFGQVRYHEDSLKQNGSDGGRRPSTTNRLPFKSSTLYFHYPSFSKMTGNPEVDVDAFGVVSIGPDRLDSFGAFAPFGLFALPNLARDSGFLRPIDTVYDPTNGTVSGGDIGRYVGPFTK